jgi:ribonucleoside-diphosphate reductase alpha chain
MSSIKVIKRDGSEEELNLDKIHKVLTWAAEGLNGVSVSEVELKSKIQFFNKIKTEDIHEMLIRTAADLISPETPDYQYMAARLGIFHIRKIAYQQFTPPRLYDHVTKMVAEDKYDPFLLEQYSEAEFDEMEKMIDHWRDMNFAYAGFKELEGKYLVQDRTTKEVFESPQFLFVLIPAVLFAKENNRMDWIKKYYDASSLFKVSLPTPIMSGVRTKTRQFSSCVLIECNDTLDSIKASTSAIIEYISKKAGIGLNPGAIRAVKSKIKKGESESTGMIPFVKMFQGAVKSCSQGGVRGGAATLFFPVWHLEIESLIVLKNNKGVEENRARHLDYGIQFSRLFYQRLIKGEKISLFSPGEMETPGLYKAFFEDQDKFEELYVKYENDSSIKKRIIPARELFSSILVERANTGRIYIQNVDHCNTHSAFDPSVAPIRQSNLCMEITLPTKPVSLKDETAGEIALCTLSAVNLGTLEKLDDLEEIAELLVYSLDNLLSFQDYPVEEARKSSLKRRTLGVGVINYAYYLAKNKVKYSDGSAIELTHKTFEALQYFLLKASNKLAREKGACEWFHETTYAKGILPIDTYKKDLDNFANIPLQYDWETLRADIVKYGLRNSTLTALMPSETSSQVSNATNGIEPPRSFVSVKGNKTSGYKKQVVPEFERLKDYYELAFDMPSNTGFLQLIGVMQKFVDQSISANTYYKPANFEGSSVPMKVLMKDLTDSYKFGLKTLYYHNTHSSDDESLDAFVDDCEGGACKI